MTGPLRAEPAPRTSRSDAGAAVAHGVSRALSLAAAPTFAAMALLIGIAGGAMPDLLCSVDGGSPLGGMVPMYLLMSLFHAAPWLKLVSCGRSGAGPS